MSFNLRTSVGDYEIVKDLSGHDTYPIQSGWYIVDDMGDGRVKISEYDEGQDIWGEDILVQEITRGE